MFKNGSAWDLKERKAVVGQPSMMISFQCPWPYVEWEDDDRQKWDELLERLRDDDFFITSMLSRLKEKVWPLKMLWSVYEDWDRVLYYLKQLAAAASAHSGGSGKDTVVLMATTLLDTRNSFARTTSRPPAKIQSSRARSCST